MRVTSTISACLAALAVFSLSSCNDAPVEASSHEGLHDAAQMSAMANRTDGVTDAQAALITALHASTARYHSKVQATKAGYSVASPCIAAPGLGGMGFHWVKGSAVDPVYDPNEPEAVLYDTNGKLVAIEYIVINVGQPRPTFAGHPFDINGAPLPVEHWTQHVWLDQENPSGIFAPFNPTVTCP